MKCIPHGEEALPYQTQVFCDINDIIVWDQATEKAVCGIGDADLADRYDGIDACVDG